MTPSKVSVIIVNWNAAASLAQCLDSIKYPHLEVIIIDNASDEPYIPPTKVIYIKNKTNVGLPKAWNQGLKLATGDYYLILNPDTRLPENFFTKAIDFAKSHPDMGVIGPELINPDGTLQGSIFNELSVFKFTPKYSLPSVSVVNAISGACMFFPKEVLKKIGPFTEQVFMYYEDLDYCRRIRKSGLKVYFNPEIKVVHEHGTSTKKSPTEKYRNLIETLIYPLRKLLNKPNQVNSVERYRTEAGIWYNGWFKQLLITSIIWSKERFQRLLKSSGIISQ